MFKAADYSHDSQHEAYPLCICTCLATLFTATCSELYLYRLKLHYHMLNGLSQ